MELKVYNKHNAMQEPVGRQKDPAISFGKSGVIRLNKALVNKLEIEPGDGLQVAQDPNNKDDWYFSIHENGIPLRAGLSKKEPDGSLVCQSSTIVKDLQKAIEVEGSANCRVGLTADELGWYPIFTASAKN